MLMRRPIYLATLTLAVAAACQPAKPDVSGLRARGDSLKGRGEYDLAIRAYDEALTLDSMNGHVLNSRGGAYKEKGEYLRAIADFDRAIAINPNHGQALKNRGRVKFYLGRFAEAAADLERGLQSDSANAYNALWIHIARRRLGEDDAVQFAAQIGRADTINWPAPVGKYFLGKITAAELRAAAAMIDPRVKQNQKCAAAFYLAEDAMMRVRTAEARPLFEEARATCPKEWTEFQATVEELKRLAPPGDQPRLNK